MVRRIKTELAIASVIVMAVLGGCLFWLFGTSYKNDMRDSAMRELDSVREFAVIEQQEHPIGDTLDAEYIKKADAAAQMISLDHALLTDTQRLRDAAELLGFDEIHITDENGIIWWGTEEGHYGFDFAKADQSKPMLDILKDESLKIAQQPQKNGFGVEFKYIGVARRDSKGIVMAGIDPAKLPKIEQQQQAEPFESNYTFGQGGFVFMLDENNVVVNHPINGSVIGKTAAEAGIDTAILNDGFEGETIIDGEEFYCITKQGENRLMVAAIPMDELYGSRNEAMVVACAMGLFVLFACQIMAGLAVKHNVIKKIRAFSDGVERAKKENVVFSERSCKEYGVLSDKLNSTVSTLKKNGGENGISGDEANKLFDAVKKIGGEQMNAANQLDKQLAGVFEKANESTKCVNSVIESAQKCERLALDGGSRMSGMLASFYNIDELSSQIRELSAQAEEIAETTGKLAFNAAVEASRAGENGQRFAAIADQVRKLASKSAGLSGSVITLSHDVTEAARTGGDAARSAVGTFSGLEDSSKSCVDRVKKISEINRAQNAIIRGSAVSLGSMVENINSLSNISANRGKEPAAKIEEPEPELREEKSAEIKGEPVFLPGFPKEEKAAEPKQEPVFNLQPESIEEKPEPVFEPQPEIEAEPEPIKENPVEERPEPVFEPQPEIKAEPEPIEENPVEEKPQPVFAPQPEIKAEPAAEVNKPQAENILASNNKKLDSMVEALLAARAAKKAAEAANRPAAVFDDSVLTKRTENIDQAVSDILDEFSRK